MVGKFLTTSYLILFEFQVLGSIYKTFCIVLFVLGFEAPLKMCLWLMLWTQHWPIAGHLLDGTPMMQRLH
jgi:hypothetical protein